MDSVNGNIHKNVYIVLSSQQNIEATIAFNRRLKAIGRNDTELTQQVSVQSNTGDQWWNE